MFGILYVRLFCCWKIFSIGQKDFTRFVSGFNSSNFCSFRINYLKDKTKQKKKVSMHLMIIHVDKDIFLFEVAIER